MSTHRANNIRQQHGIVLIAVLWMVAALSIMVVGMVNSTRKEARRVGHDRQSMVAIAQGDAAIHLALQLLKAKPVAVNQILRMSVGYDGATYSVLVQPLSGLIDINNASKELLSSTLVIAAQWDKGAADSMATALLEFRSRKDARGVAMGFEAVEDLLSVPGFDYSTYARLKQLVTADTIGSGRVNPLAAFPDVLTVLADGNSARATQIATARDAGAVGVDTTGLNSGFVDAAPSSRVRLETLVTLPDGGNLIASRSVDLTPSPRDGIPWRTFRSEHRLLATSDAHP